MKKFIRRMVICCLITSFCWLASVIADRDTLDNNLIRFHVVANSDSVEDQRIKLHVRDAVLQSIEYDLKQISDIGEAKAYLQQNLPRIQSLVDHTLAGLGFQGNSHVTLCKEPYDIRHYDTFSLPAGVYDSLRIIIGDGLGKNWWCVSFPTLCIPATTKGFADTAVSAGFSEPLVNTLSGNEHYEIRFFFLNQLGKLENILLKE